MNDNAVKPQAVSGENISLVGPGHDDNHYITVPIKELYAIDGVGDVGVCHMGPGDETCVFGIEEEDDGTALHHYGPVSYTHLRAHET